MEIKNLKTTLEIRTVYTRWPDYTDVQNEIKCAQI